MFYYIRNFDVYVISELCIIAFYGKAAFQQQCLLQRLQVFYYDCVLTNDKLNFKTLVVETFNEN